MRFVLQTWMYCVSDYVQMHLQHRPYCPVNLMARKHILLLYGITYTMSIT